MAKKRSKNKTKKANKPIKEITYQWYCDHWPELLKATKLPTDNKDGAFCELNGELLVFRGN